MPEPVKRNQRYMPGLDGLRAVAVLAVIAFHLGFGWAPGGLLGVGIFFTLSGYLITDILLSQLSRHGHIRLGKFWLARARRLLPALFAMLVIVVAWVAIFGPAQPQQFRDGVVASALYVSNWQLIFGDVSYFARFAPPGPLNSVAAEGKAVRVEEAVAAGTAKPPPLTPAQANSSTRSSCKAVVHIGDSTSEGLTSPNEAANVFVGSAVGEMERIEIMMNPIGDEPVMWVNVRSLVEAGDPYAAENMEKWDEELLVACRRYPNMRVYDWASDVKDAWFIEDGIHFTSPGYAARSELIAHALAHAFPASGESEGAANCLGQLTLTFFTKRARVAQSTQLPEGPSPT